MILITSTGEFLYCKFFLVSFHCKKKKKICCRIVCVVLCCPVLATGVHFGLNCGPMEYLEGEQHSQYEGNLRAHRSMRDYRNSPWMNVPSCIVPPTNVL